ncbi:putative ribonuclease H-like domain-containing protein [Tanacetum coccineum]
MAVSYLLLGENYSIWKYQSTPKTFGLSVYYPIWEVIQRGNGPVSVSTDTNGQIKVLPPKTAKEILAREKERKARTTLLMAIPEDHLAKFHKMTNAKEMWDAIKSRFERLHKSYDMFQSLLSQIEIHGAGVDSLSFDDLYNNLRVFETDVKGSTGSSSSAQNVAFVSSESTSSTNDVSTAYGATTSSGYNSQRENSSSYTDELMHSFFANQSSGLQLDHEDLEQIDESKGNQDIRRRDAGNTGYKAKDSGRRPGNQEEPKALGTLDGDGVDWTGHAEDEQENFALMAYSHSGSDTEICKVEGMHSSSSPMTGNITASKSDFGIDESHVETLESVPEPVVIEHKVVSQPKVWFDAPIIEEYESDSDDEYVIKSSKHETPSFAFVNTVKHVKTLRETVKEQNTCNQSPKVDKRDWNGLMSKKMGLGYGFTRKACFKSKGTGQGENRPVWNNVQRLNHQNKFVPTTVLIRTGRFPVNTARHNFNSQAISTSADRKANADDLQLTLKGKGIVDSGCFRHMTGNKAYLVDYKEFKGGSVVFGGSKGPKEANNSAGTQDDNDAGNSEIEAEPAQEYFVLPLWSSYTSTIKSLEAKNGGEKPNRDIGTIDEEALYGLHQAPRAWYATLSAFLEKSGYKRGTIDKTLFIKRDKKDIMLVQVYVDAIIFGSTKKSWCDEFEALMKSRFQMSSMGELTFFLGLQVKQKEDGIFISQDKYVAEILKKFDFMSVKTASTPIETQKPLVKDEEAADVDVHLYRSMIGSLMYLTASRPDIMFAVCACSRFQVTPKTSHLHAVKRIFRYLKGKPKLGLWYPRVSAFDLEAYSDSDYAGANLDRKSTTGGCQFLGRRLISWQCKKQTIVATSTTEAEYVAAANCCGQVLWIQNQMLDYGFNFLNTKIYIDNESTICIVKNPVFHSKTKHIEIRHHFIRDAYEKKLIQVLKIHTDDNVADLLTKAFNHNMVACFEKTEWNTQFHEIVDFLTRSSIYYSLTVSPTVSTSLIEQFWNTATSKTVNDVSYIKAKVAGKTVSISEASIRRDLLFNDVDGIDYRKFNFSKMIFEGMIRNLDAKKKFLMYPRFVQVFLNNQLSNLPAPLDNLPIPVLTKKVFTNMAKQGLHFSGHVTSLFPNMLAQTVVDEGEGGHTSDRAEGGLNLEESSVLCTNLLNRVLALETSKGAQAVEILKLKTRIKKLKKKCQPVISHHMAWLRSVSRLSMKKNLGKKESVSKQGRKNAKSGLKLDDSAFDNLDADLAHGMDDMETEEAVNEGRQSNETEELNLDADTEVIADDKGSCEKGGSIVSTARPEVSTARQKIGTADPTTPPTTTTIFDDEEMTLTDTLVKRKDNKAKVEAREMYNKMNFVMEARNDNALTKQLQENRVTVAANSLHLGVINTNLTRNDELSPLHTTPIVEKCTLKLVDEYKHILCQTTEPLCQPS